VFVEKSPLAVAALRANAAKLGASGASIQATDARSYLQQSGAGPFDIVFLDPPFAAGLLPELCAQLEAAAMLAPDARVYIEEDRATAACELPPHWQVLKTANAGNVRYSLVATGRGTARTMP
jgi:16S rRNA (guanine966-N2)-methyltransferase